MSLLYHLKLHMWLLFHFYGTALPTPFHYPGVGLWDQYWLLSAAQGKICVCVCTCLCRGQEWRPENAQREKEGTKEGKRSEQFRSISVWDAIHSYLKEEELGQVSSPQGSFVLCFGIEWITGTSDSSEFKCKHRQSLRNFSSAHVTFWEPLSSLSLLAKITETWSVIQTDHSDLDKGCNVFCAATFHKREISGCDRTF